MPVSTSTPRHRCLALITELKPALDDITDQLLRDETIPGSAVAEAIARASGLEACGALNRALAFVPERSADSRAGDGEPSIAAAFRGE